MCNGPRLGDRYEISCLVVRDETRILDRWDVLMRQTERHLHNDLSGDGVDCRSLLLDDEFVREIGKCHDAVSADAS
ncbi:hypothetical protein C491_17654 [Natronococcus amylolyticus DSM 10524]|uniref:Uncharacterized protein n=1 Tax=Natronococcus amylolyticus DSM 10524 TaxID=1227497 RepID=L9X0H6_9EURY|nr:hypothetical protein C491_17654 [Natronococcus amylolyticus DSM 10524]